jgi:hypothetical protein
MAPPNADGHAVEPKWAFTQKGLGSHRAEGEEGVQGWGSLRQALPAEGEGMALPLNQ